MIARSIIAAQTGERQADEVYTEDGKTHRTKNNPFSQGGLFGAKEEKGQREEQAVKEKKPFVFDFNAWYAKILYVLIFVLLVFLVFGLIKVGFWFLVHFGIPILIFLGIIYLILYFMR